MSMETWTEDWKRESDEYSLKEKLEILEKFVSRIDDVVQAYKYEEKYKDIISDLIWELKNVEEEI